MYVSIPSDHHCAPAMRVSGLVVRWKREGKGGVTYTSKDPRAGARLASMGVADGERFARDEPFWDACCGGGAGDGKDGGDGLHFVWGAGVEL